MCAMFVKIMYVVLKVHQLLEDCVFIMSLFRCAFPIDLIQSSAMTGIKMRL